MKRINLYRRSGSKFSPVSIILIVISMILLVAGIILILIDPIKRLNRKRISGDALKTIESKIEATEESVPQITYVVPARGNEVEGESYDFVGETEEEEEEDYYDDEYVVLNSIGILEISSINIRYPVWDEATTVALRYGLGHYVDSVMPGERGNATILGHNYRDGSMFHYLGSVDIGDEVIFTDLYGNETVFYVTDSLIVDADDLLDYALGEITKARQLTLVTCTYEYGMKGWRRVVICRPYGEEEPEEPVETTVETTLETTLETTAETTGETSGETVETTVETTAETTAETTTETTVETTAETAAPVDENSGNGSDGGAGSDTDAGAGV